jgi:hypothetical protein
MADGSERKNIKRCVYLLGGIFVVLVLIVTLNMGHAATPSAASRHVNHAIRMEFSFTKLGRLTARN